MLKNISPSDVKHMMTSPIKTITSVLKVSIDITTSITVHPIGLAAILAIMSVSTSKTAVILYLSYPHFIFQNSIQQSLPFSIFGGLALTCGILICFLPETSGKPLPDKLNVEIIIDTPLTDKSVNSEENQEVREDVHLQNGNAF